MENDQTFLQELKLSNNQLTGTLEPLKACEILQTLEVPKSIEVTDDDRSRYGTKLTVM